MKFGNVSEVAPWKAGQAPPPGIYKARIDEADEGTSTGGHPQFILEWTVVGGQYDGAAIREWLVIPKTGPGHDIGLQKLVALVDAVGIDRSSEDFELDAKVLVGKEAAIVCISEPSFKDPSKSYTNVAGHRSPATVSNGNGSQADADVPGDTSDLPF